MSNEAIQQAIYFHIWYHIQGICIYLYSKLQPHNFQ